MASIVVRGEAKRIPRPEFVALAEDGRHFHVAIFAEHLSIRSRRLDHYHGGGEPLVALGEHKVLGPRAEDDFLAFLPTGTARHRHRRAAVEGHLHLAIRALERSRKEIHRGRADEAGDEDIRRMVVELEGTAALLDEPVA